LSGKYLKKPQEVAMKILVDKEDVINARKNIARIENHPLLHGLIIGDVVKNIATEVDDLLLKMLTENEESVHPPIGNIEFLTSSAIQEGNCVFISTRTDAVRIKQALVDHYQENK
jgi:hypothetical protein